MDPIEQVGVEPPNWLRAAQWLGNDEKRAERGCKVLQHFLPPYLSFSPDKQLWEETKSNEWSFEESLERSRPLWLWWLCMFAPKSIEPQVPLCLYSSGRHWSNSGNSKEGARERVGLYYCAARSEMFSKTRAATERSRVDEQNIPGAAI